MRPKSARGPRTGLSMPRICPLNAKKSCHLKINRQQPCQRWLRRPSLKREWFVVRDENSPVSIEGSTGIQVAYKSGERYSSGQYQYNVMYQLKAKEPIAAFEIRVHVLDVFGRLLKTLSASELVDFSDSRSFDGTWRIWSENEASEAFASVAYVAQVRTASGRVYEADRAAVFDQVRKVARRITEADLEPKREAPPKP